MEDNSVAQVQQASDMMKAMGTREGNHWEMQREEKTEGGEGRKRVAARHDR